MIVRRLRSVLPEALYRARFKPPEHQEIRSSKCGLTKSNADESEQVVAETTHPQG